MPFTSKKQEKLCWLKYNQAKKSGKTPSWDCEKWESETKNKNLPNRSKSKTASKSRKTKSNTSYKSNKTKNKTASKSKSTKTRSKTNITNRRTKTIK